LWEVVGLERNPLSLGSTTEEQLGRSSSGSGLESRKFGCGEPLRCPLDTLYPRKFALTSLTSGGRSVGIVRWRTKVTESVIFVCRTYTTGLSIHIMLCGKSHSFLCRWTYNKEHGSCFALFAGSTWHERLIDRPWPPVSTTGRTSTKSCWNSQHW
jgi:hypothetical protein